MVSAHPNADLGEIGWPRTHVHIFRSLDFGPVSRTPHEANGIGWGATEPSCVEALERLTRDEYSRFALMQAAVAIPGGLVAVLGDSLMRHISDATPRGISPHLNLCFVTRGRVVIGTDDRTTFGREGPVEFRMPRLARSPAELRAILSERGSSAERCMALVC